MATAGHDDARDEREESMTPTAQRTIPIKTAWGAVSALALGVLGLVMAELLPVSLLTPMARDLGITEGAAGQTVSVTAAVAVFASLFVAHLTRGVDRRRVLLTLAGLLVASSLLAAFSPNLSTLLVGRVLLGVAIGGFWSMSGATAMRLVPSADVPRALSIIFGAGSFGVVVAAPMGSALGDLIGWRGVFGVPAALGAAAWLWQLATLPAMASPAVTRLRALIDIPRRPGIGLGFVGVLLVFAGHFAFFTYLRPFLETVTKVDVRTLSAVLLGFGLANLIGTWAAERLIGWNLRLTLGLTPLLMSALALALITAGSVPLVAATLIALWGVPYGTVGASWVTWITRVVPDEAETGGGILVAAIQFAIALGAAAGGVAMDMSGARAAFAVSAVALLLAAVIVLARLKTHATSTAELPRSVQAAAA
jgi:predicted MFS family arabinose efflux permease